MVCGAEFNLKFKLGVDSCQSCRVGIGMNWLNHIVAANPFNSQQLRQLLYSDDLHETPTFVCSYMKEALRSENAQQKIKDNPREGGG